MPERARFDGGPHVAARDLVDDERELGRIRQRCRRIIWLNPLIGSDGYQPLTRGMAAALPYCDDFLAAHNLKALDDLGSLLAGLDTRSSRR